MDMDMVDMAIPLGSRFCATISAHALYPHGYSPHADPVIVDCTDVLIVIRLSIIS